jgi:hypothetical protein
MSGWLILYPLVGNLARAAGQAWPRRWATWSAVRFAVSAVLIVGHAATGFGKLVVPEAFRRGDPTLEAVEWTPLCRELAARSYLDRKDMFVVATYWVEAGRIDQALGGALPVVVFGGWNASKNYDLRYDQRAFLGRDALIIGAKIKRDIEAHLRRFSGRSRSCRRFRSAAPEMEEIKAADAVFLALCASRECGERPWRRRFRGDPLSRRKTRAEVPANVDPHRPRRYGPAASPGGAPARWGVAKW